MSLAPDLTLADRYQLEERIAIGGMGEVWRARDQLLSRRVAVKVLKPEYAADPTFLERFRNEAKHTAALSHPGIASIYDYGEVGDMAFLVMECVPGESLSLLLAREDRLPASRTLDIIGQAGLALQAAHDVGVVHRDVKPGNLLVQPDGVVKVTDFGIARAVDASPVTQTGLVVGTAAYLSPEQAAGRPVTPASDVYSLGLVGYECLTGQRAFDGDNAVAIAMAQINAKPAKMPKDVPPLVGEFVMRMLEKDPDKRPQSAGDLGRTALALAATMRNSATDTKLLPEADVQTVERLPSYDEKRRRKVRNTFIAIAAVVVLLGFLVLHSCAGGAQRVTMPKVTGETYAHAATTLQTQGFAVTKRLTPNASHAAGLVLAQSIAPGARVGNGSIVTLTVSSGPPLVQVDAASLIGQQLDAVQNTLTAEKLRVAVTSQDSSRPPGTVIAVSPSGQVPQGSTVTVTIASAPPKPTPKHHGKGEHG